MNIEDKWNDKLRKAYDTISVLSREAYTDIYLLSNEVLSKNPLTNHFLEYFLSDVQPGVQSGIAIAYKLLRYYVYSLVYFLIYLIEGIIWQVLGSRYKPTKSHEELVAIDTFFLVNNIVTSGKYSEMYLRGLDDVLDELGKHYVYLPVFYGGNNIRAFGAVLRVLRENQVPVLTEYQLLTCRDWFHLIAFILVYPWRVLKFAQKLNADDRSAGLVRYEMIDTLDQATFKNFSRYLQGKRIAELPYNKIKVISWYENQVIDKNLYKGLRANKNKVTIYGAQLFLIHQHILNVFPDENEKIFGIIPDHIIVNGPYFIPRNSKLNYTIGPSLRYTKIFKQSMNHKKGENILVLLPYSANETEDILRLISGLENMKNKILIKAHPANSIERYKNLLPQGCKVVSEDIYSLFEVSKVVVGSASGSLVEAASMGIPVISVMDRRAWDTNYLPDYGRGIIWGEVSSVEELKRQINIFSNINDNESKKMNDIVKTYRNMFFCEPTKGKIIEAFNLK
jgi:hypothetical protein